MTGKIHLQQPFKLAAFIAIKVGDFLCGHGSNPRFVTIHPLLATCMHCIKAWENNKDWYAHMIGQEIAIPDEEDDEQGMGGGPNAGRDDGDSSSSGRFRSLATEHGVRVFANDQEDRGDVLLPRTSAVCEKTHRAQAEGWETAMERVSANVGHKHSFKLDHVGNWVYVWKCEVCFARVVKFKHYFREEVMGNEVRNLSSGQHRRGSR